MFQRVKDVMLWCCHTIFFWLQGPTIHYLHSCQVFHCQMQFFPLIFFSCSPLHRIGSVTFYLSALDFLIPQFEIQSLMNWIFSLLKLEFESQLSTTSLCQMLCGSLNKIRNPANHMKKRNKKHQNAESIDKKLKTNGLITLVVQVFRRPKNQPLLIQRSRPSRDSQEPKTRKKFQFP